MPDEVHFHNIRFQLIFCVAGWVRLVYEGQVSFLAGRLRAAAAGIRRVLESSAAEVVEVTCPAMHETWFDTEMSLPTPDRRDVFGGQRFCSPRRLAKWQSCGRRASSARHGRRPAGSSVPASCARPPRRRTPPTAAVVVPPRRLGSVRATPSGSPRATPSPSQLMEHALLGTSSELRAIAG